VLLFDFGLLPDGRPATVLEYLEGGGDLQQVLQERQRLPLDEVIELGQQAALALDAAHQRGVVHCDVKPANLYLGRDPNGQAVVKVMDFGVARLIGQGRALVRPADDAAPETPEGIVIGTPEYLAPEQIRGRSEAGAPADMYSLGVVLYQAITGRRPFRSESLMGLFHAHLVASPQPIEDFEAPPALQAVVKRCLAKEPGERYADMAALARALDEVRVQVGSWQRSADTTRTLHRADIAAVTRPARAARSSGLGPALLALGAVAAAGALWTLRRPGAAPPPAAPARAAAARPATGANPYTAGDAAAVASGAAIYVAHCARCHGEHGDGAGRDIPAGLEPKSFADARVPSGLLDVYRFEVIRRGIEQGGRRVMPSFAGQLDVNDTWRVVTYLATLAQAAAQAADARARTEAAAREARPTTAEDTAALRQEGAVLFRRKCASCHGTDGRGKGPASRYLPRPVADLTRGVYKLRSTPRGELPTDEDIFATVTRGMGTAGMPSFARLPARQRWALVAYVKSLAPRFASGGPPAEEVLTIPPRRRTGPADIDDGQHAYRLAGCPVCHGDSGRGDGPRAARLADDQGRPIRPTDLTRRFFIGGTEPRDIYRTVMTGIDGTPMPQGSDFFTAEQGWQVVAYILSLRGR
jgi:mono/diheme cytochrome c family protein